MFRFKEEQKINFVVGKKVLFVCSYIIISGSLMASGQRVGWKERGEGREGGGGEGVGRLGVG